MKLICGRCIPSSLPLNVLYDGGSAPGTWRILTPVNILSTKNHFEAKDKKCDDQKKMYLFKRVKAIKIIDNFSRVSVFDGSQRKHSVAILRGVFQ